MTVVGAPATIAAGAEKTSRDADAGTTVTAPEESAIKGAPAVIVWRPAPKRVMSLVKTCVPASAAVKVYDRAGEVIRGSLLPRSTGPR